MTDRIELRGLQGRGFHGVFDSERQKGQPFLVDAVLHVDTRQAAASDELADTVDYGDIARRMLEIIEGDPVSLIEKLAQLLADACLVDERVEQVEITVHKPDAPIPATFDDVAVTIVRGRR